MHGECDDSQAIISAMEMAFKDNLEFRIFLCLFHVKDATQRNVKSYPEFSGTANAENRELVLEMISETLCAPTVDEYENRKSYLLNCDLVLSSPQLLKYLTDTLFSTTNEKNTALCFRVNKPYKGVNTSNYIEAAFLKL